MFKQWKEDMIYLITYKPESTYYYNDANKIESIKFKRDGKYHNIDFPAIIRYNEDGNINNMIYLLEGKLHRSPTDGPADICYYKNGNIRRECYWLEDKKHRSDGPAFIWYLTDGSIWFEEYYIEDKKHRPPTDGPAVIEYHPDGDGHIAHEEYWIEGKCIQ